MGNNKRFIDELKLKAVTAGIAATTAVGSFGCANVQKQNVPAVQNEQTIDETNNSKEELSIEELYEKLEQDMEIFRKNNYSKLTRKEKVVAERKAKKDMSDLLRTELANAITEGTGKKCNFDDVWLIYPMYTADIGFTWAGAENTYTKNGFHGKGNTICNQIARLIEAYSKACIAGHFDINDGITFTNRKDLIGNKIDDESIRHFFEFAIYCVLRTTRDNEITFDGKEFSLVPVEEKRDSSAISEENKTIEEIETYSEEEQSLEFLLNKLKEDNKMFQSSAIYSAMDLSQQTELEEETLYDMGAVIRKYLANAITEGTGEEISSEDVNLFYSIRARNGGFALEGADCTYTETGFRTTGDQVRDETIPTEIVDTINKMTNAAQIQHYSNENGIAITRQNGS